MRFPEFRTLFFTAALITSFSLGQDKAQASYTDVKSSGMGGAVCAHPIDSLVAAYNPGGLGFVGDRWDLGVHWVKLWGNANYKNNPFFSGKVSSHASEDNLFIPEFAVNRFTCDQRFTWGFAIYDRSFFKTQYKDPNPIFGTSKPGLEYIHGVASPTFSLIIAEQHCLGVTIDFHGQRLKINGMQNFANDIDSKHPENVTNKGYDYSGGIGATVGWMSKVSECVAIGIAWSPTVYMSHFRDYKGIVARKGRVNIPQRFLGGVAIEMVDNFTVAFDIEHTQYNEISPLNHPLLPNLFEKKLGSDRGAGLGWMDQTTFRLGVDWIIDDGLAVRAGYIYHRDPIKTSQTLANSLIPNIINRVVTVGGTWRFGYCNELSFYGAYEFCNHKSGRDSIPDEFGGGEVKLKEENWRVGLSWGRFF